MFQLLTFGDRHGIRFRFGDEKGIVSEQPTTSELRSKATPSNAEARRLDLESCLLGELANGSLSGRAKIKSVLNTGGHEKDGVARKLLVVMSLVNIQFESAVARTDGKDYAATRAAVEAHNEAAKHTSSTCLS